jgi:hypothetical protein
MEKQIKTYKVELPETAFRRIEEIQSRLKERSIKRNVSFIFEKLVLQAPKDVDQKIVEELTPIEWKIKQAMDNPQKRNVIEKMFRELEL